MKNKKGFTLVELAIIMAIVFILIAIRLGQLEENKEFDKFKKESNIIISQ